jgi:hypothetical protein
MPNAMERESEREKGDYKNSMRYLPDFENSA